MAVSQKLMKLEKNTNHEHDNKYIATQDFDMLTTNSFAHRLKQANLAIKNDNDDFVKNRYFHNKLININKNVT